MYTFKTNIDENEYNDFIKKYKYMNFMQEKSFLAVKS